MLFLWKESIEKLGCGECWQNAVVLFTNYEASFCSSVVLNLNLDFFNCEDIIHLVGMPVGINSKYLFVLNFCCTGLNNHRE